ncbi:hypothetical protein I7I50_01128 [Histoplasma capsulatum G186AR]|uniref:Uncharacterized protein n=1 Tax=Ajellomyces capsulatus TaxID=5037 RepID=A0A8H7YUU7_AJECA|nr:hypothetical protein I7I52_09049 [Histoplasma capsulatum]QSS73092.1 hypothetical protein I7I50_01128 [Histoplasma capsulatum G186AR]
MFSTLKIEQAKARIVSLSALIGESGVVKVVAVGFSFPFTGEGFTYMYVLYLYFQSSIDDSYWSSPYRCR